MPRELPRRDRPLLFWKIRDVLLDRGVQVELSLFDEKPDRGGRQRLGDVADPEAGFADQPRGFSQQHGSRCSGVLGAVGAEVLPQPERHLGQHDAAAPAATVGMPAVTVIGSDIGHAESLSPPAGTADGAP